MRLQDLRETGPIQPRPPAPYTPKVNPVQPSNPDPQDPPPQQPPPRTPTPKPDGDGIGDIIDVEAFDISDPRSLGPVLGMLIAADALRRMGGGGGWSRQLAPQ
jgi:hypothetical protein